MWSSQKIECFGATHHIDQKEKKLHFFGKKQRVGKYLKEKRLDSLGYKLIIKEFLELENEDRIFPNFNIENLNFKQELAKICAGYATKLGIKRDFLNRIDLLRKSLLQVHPVYQCSD